MPGSMPATSQLDWLSSMTAMIVLFWSRATRDLLKSFGWGIAALHRLDAAMKLPFPRRPPHSISRSLSRESELRQLPLLLQLRPDLEQTGGMLLVVCDCVDDGTAQHVKGIIFGVVGLQDPKGFSDVVVD